jgi:hypothetical protein
MTTASETSFDFGRLRRGLESAVPRDIVGLYAADAELIVVVRDRPPSARLRLSGQGTVEAFWRDVSAREMTQADPRDVVGSGRAVVEECVYRDGCHVMSSLTLNLAKGLIPRHLVVRAWDDLSCVLANPSAGASPGGCGLA